MRTGAAAKAGEAPARGREDGDQRLITFPLSKTQIRGDTCCARQGSDPVRSHAGPLPRVNPPSQVTKGQLSKLESDSGMRLWEAWQRSAQPELVLRNVCAFG